MNHMSEAFKGAGIWPVNRNVFQDEDYLPSDNICSQPNVDIDDSPFTDHDVNTLPIVNSADAVVVFTESLNLDKGKSLIMSI